MKLDDAYNAWGGQSENRELAQKTKKIFHNIWWLIPTNQPCNYYTLEVLGRALVQANGAQSDKVKAASVMVHVLNYAHNIDPEGNNKPDFTFSDIVNYTGEKEEMTGDRSQMTGDRSPAEQTREDALPGTCPPSSCPPSSQPLVKVKPEAKAKRMAELAKRDGGEAATKAGKAVVQLDAEALKPIKVWPSCFAAQKELGIKNVQRAIVRHGISGGFYWCRPGDEEGFKPLEKRGRGKNKTKTDESKPLPKVTYLPTQEDKDLMRRVFGHDRGQVPGRSQTREDAAAGDLSPVMERQPTPEQQKQLKEAEVAVAEARRDFEEQIAEHVDSILRSCTDDELIAELRRREWHGTLRITRTIEL